MTFCKCSNAYFCEPSCMVRVSTCILSIRIATNPAERVVDLFLLSLSLLSLSLFVISSLYWKPYTRRKCKHAYTAACITWRRSHLSSSTSDEMSGSVSRSPDRIRQWRIGLGWFLITYHPSLFPRVPSPRVYSRNRQLGDQFARF